MNLKSLKKETYSYHRFLDEAGDLSFFGKGKVNIAGINGASCAFMLGMAKFKKDLNAIRSEILTFSESVVNGLYFDGVPSVEKRKQKGQFYFHAKDDVPEVRKIMFDYLCNELDFTLEVVVGRKIARLFASKHNSRQNEFYADMLSHLLKNKLHIPGKIVLNIADRWSSTAHNSLNQALDKAKMRYAKKDPHGTPICDVQFNVQTPTNGPLLCVPDYALWTVQRVFERGDIRYYKLLQDKIRLVLDIYDSSKYGGSRHYYTPKNPLTVHNKIGPHSL